MPLPASALVRVSAGGPAGRARHVREQAAVDVDGRGLHAAWASAVPPADSMSAATALAPSAFRSAATTAAPRAAHSSAAARPMPDAAPVMTTTLPSSELAG